MESLFVTQKRNSELKKLISVNIILIWRFYAEYTNGFATLSFSKKKILMRYYCQDRNEPSAAAKHFLR
jgi:hypothetical protein